MTARFENQIIWVIGNIKDSKTKKIYQDKLKSIKDCPNKEDRELGLIALIKTLEEYEK